MKFMATLLLGVSHLYQWEFLAQSFLFLLLDLYQRGGLYLDGGLVGLLQVILAECLENQRFFLSFLYM